MTRRQYLTFLAWLPYEAARIEFRIPERTDRRRGPEKWRLTKERAAAMNRANAKAQFVGLLGADAAKKPTGIVTKPR